jgi:hypothetical protein
MHNAGYSAKTRIVTVVTVSFICILIIIVLISVWPSSKIFYGNDRSLVDINATTTVIEASSSIPVFMVTHVQAPDEVRAVYFTSWAAGTPSFQKEMFSLVNGSTTLNSLVIDVKDYSGRISFPMDDPEINKIGSVQERIPNIKEMIGKLHEKGVYVIGRIAVFQDPFIVKVRPEWSVHNKNTGAIWRDSGGAYWTDPDNQAMWKYVVDIAKQSYAVGFDEINFDYVRFPSEGISTAVFDKTASTTKAHVIKQFFSYLHDELSPLGIPISADLFGQTTSDKGDMGIGQYFENALPYFDYVDPMVYPSHYISGYLNYTKPAEHPYEIVKYELATAVARSLAASTVVQSVGSTTASSTLMSSTSVRVPLYKPAKIRPWLQAFDLGAVYTPAMVHTQIQATSDAGASGWLLWNAGSVYKREFVMPVTTSTSTALR